MISKSNNKPFSVITYIYGKNENLHEVANPDNETDYVCVTDNPALRSNTWRIIYEPLSHLQHNRLKFAYVKTHPFKYVNGHHVCIMDGTMSIGRSIKTLFNECGDGIMMKLHPCRNSLCAELDAWHEQRGLSDECVNSFRKMATALHANISSGPVYESCIMIWANNELTKMFGDAVFTSMLTLSNKNSIFLSNQLVMSLLLQSVFSKIPVKLIDQEKYFTRYAHNSNKVYQHLNSSTSNNMKAKESRPSRIVDDMTLLSANFNTPILTLHMIKSLYKQLGYSIPMCIIDNSTTLPMPDINSRVLTIIDNTNFRITPDYGQCSANHCASLEFAMNAIKTRYILLCDSDILFRPEIRTVLEQPVGAFDAFGEIGWDKHPGNRLFPYCCIIDNKKKRMDGISYFDPDRIMVDCLGQAYNSKHPPKTNVQAYFDTGASFLNDILFHKWNIKSVRLDDIIVHKKGGTLHPDNNLSIDDWLEKYKSLWEEPNTYENEQMRSPYNNE